MLDRPSKSASTPLPGLEEKNLQSDVESISSISVNISPDVKAKRTLAIKRAARISIFINNKNVQAPHDHIHQNQEVKQDAAPIQNSGIMVSLKKLCGC